MKTIYKINNTFFSYVIQIHEQKDAKVKLILKIFRPSGIAVDIEYDTSIKSFLDELKNNFKFIDNTPYFDHFPATKEFDTYNNAWKAIPELKKFILNWLKNNATIIREFDDKDISEILPSHGGYLNT